MFELEIKEITTLPPAFCYAYPTAKSLQLMRKISLKTKQHIGEIEVFDPYSRCWSDGSMSEEPDVSRLSLFEEYMKASGIPSYIQIHHIDNHVDFGVFATRDIPQGEFLGFYSGELGMGAYDTDSNYLFEVLEEEQIYVDAEKSGNFTRFINHTSPKKCNVGSLIFITKSDPFTIPVIILYGLKPIRKGEQLLYNYGSEYWKAMGVKPKSITPNTYTMN